ncbi:MAG: NAD/NADP octopine/nopaline dehydrogenase family protein [Promethearchaeota archaeon]
MNFCVIGAGSGGRAFAAYISSKGYPVSLYNRSYSRISSIRKRGGIRAVGELVGFFPIKLATQNLQLAIKDADIIMIAVPAFAHKHIAKKLKSLICPQQIIILNPGRTFGSVEVKKIIDRKKERNTVKVGETQTLLFTSRELPENKVNIIKIKDAVNFSAFPDKDTNFIYDKLKEVFPQFIPIDNYLEVTLNNIGMLLHPIITLLNTGMIDFGKRFKFYKEGATKRVCEVIESIELEINKIFKNLRLKQLKFYKWAKKSYNVSVNNIYEAIQKITAYKNINSPESLISRYFTEDVPTGLVPMSSLGKFLGISTPIIDSVIYLSSIICGENFEESGRTIIKLNLSDFFINYLTELRTSELELKGYYSTHHILSQPNDFIVCSHCGCINSLKNKLCWVCHLNDFRKITTRDLIKLKRNLKELIRA